MLNVGGASKFENFLGGGIPHRGENRQRLMQLPHRERDVGIRGIGRRRHHHGGMVDAQAPVRLRIVEGADHHAHILVVEPPGLHVIRHHEHVGNLKLSQLLNQRGRHRAMMR